MSGPERGKERNGGHDSKPRSGTRKISPESHVFIILSRSPTSLFFKKEKQNTQKEEDFFFRILQLGARAVANKKREKNRDCLMMIAGIAQPKLWAPCRPVLCSIYGEWLESRGESWAAVSFKSGRQLFSPVFSPSVFVIRCWTFSLPVLCGARVRCGKLRNFSSSFLKNNFE